MLRKYFLTVIKLDEILGLFVLISDSHEIVA